MTIVIDTTTEISPGDHRDNFKGSVLAMTTARSTP
jgi:hypothetical protein